MRAHDSHTELVEGTDNCNLGPLMIFLLLINCLTRFYLVDPRFV